VVRGGGRGGSNIVQKVCYGCPLIYVREHLSWVFLPQPEQFDLEITDSSLTTKNVTRDTC